MAENPNAPMLSPPHAAKLPLSETTRMALQAVFSTALGALVGAGLGAGVEAALHGAPDSVFTPGGAVDVNQTLASNLHHYAASTSVQIGALAGALGGAGLSLHGEWSARIARENAANQEAGLNLG